MDSTRANYRDKIKANAREEDHRLVRQMKESDLRNRSLGDKKKKRLAEFSKSVQSVCDWIAPGFYYNRDNNTTIPKAVTDLEEWKLIVLKAKNDRRTQDVDASSLGPFIATHMKGSVERRARLEHAKMLEGISIERTIALPVDKAAVPKVHESKKIAKVPAGPLPIYRNPPPKDVFKAIPQSSSSSTGLRKRELVRQGSVRTQPLRFNEDPVLLNRDTGRYSDTVCPPRTPITAAGFTFAPKDPMASSQLLTPVVKPTVHFKPFAVKSAAAASTVPPTTAVPQKAVVKAKKEMDALEGKVLRLAERKIHLEGGKALENGWFEIADDADWDFC
ncbi:uncharacterized protein RSE6_10196 [Rhynchosporium secalis]|uniref:Uncharacterized protein n=1 Tax=Rhynchosporium secalis TaxID=38038 RepID=A0A1E1MJU1_RHYSE|nr:uncharacterized protein RSE6_10196 [Rhynchosporium secalis]